MSPNGPFSFSLCGRALTLVMFRFLRNSQTCISTTLTDLPMRVPDEKSEQGPGSRKGHWIPSRDHLQATWRIQQNCIGQGKGTERDDYDPEQCALENVSDLQQ